jgi:hypothetical protein
MMKTSDRDAPLRASPAVERSVDAETLEWWRMSPQQRWEESMRLWDIYLWLGGSMGDGFDDEEPDFNRAVAWAAVDRIFSVADDPDPGSTD